MAVTEYWKYIGTVFALIIILSGGVGTYALVKTSSYDICTAKIDGITTRAAWRPTALSYRYMCELESKNGKPNTQWCWDLVDYGGVIDARCNLYEQIEYNSPDLGEGELTGYDLIKFEEYPISYKCSEPLVNLTDSRTDEIYLGCNASIIPDETTIDKSALARELAPEGLTYEELNVKVGGYNHYRYAFTTFEVCNIFSEELDLVSSLDAVFPDLPVKDFKLMKEDQYGKWFYYTPSSKLVASDGCEKFGITIQKNKGSERIEYGTKVSKDGEDYINHPFWDGAAGDQSHITLVVNGLYVAENWEDDGYAVGQENPLPWINDTDCGVACEAFTEFVIYDDSGNKYINISHPGPDTGSGAYLRLKYPIVGSIGNNFTQYWKGWQYENSADWSTTALQYKDDPNYHRTALERAWDRATKWGGLTYSGSSSGGVSVMFQNLDSTWYYFAFNQTMNTSSTGANLWIGASSDGDGVWNEGTNTTNNHPSYGAADRLILHQSAFTAPMQGRWDNLFIAQIPDGDYPDTITNFSCPFVYSDAGNTPCKNMTVFFYKDGSLDTTLTSTNCNSTERDWTIDIGGGDAGTWFCNATACDTGGECDNDGPTNSVNIFATNQPPVIDNINISSSSGFNLTGDSLTGAFNVSDPDADPITNQTDWYKNGAVQTVLANLTTISSGNTSVGESWIFSVRPNDGILWGDWKNSSALVILNANPIINYVLAQMNATIVYKSPELFHWLDNMTALRVNCTDADVGQPTGVHVNITDRKNTLRCDGDASLTSGDLRTYICPNNETINRSSDWYFKGSCTDGIATVTNVTYWNISWGSLAVTMTTPTTNINVRQNETFKWTGYATCSGGECINVSHALDPFLIEREGEEP